MFCHLFQFTFYKNDLFDYIFQQFCLLLGAKGSHTLTMKQREEKSNHQCRTIHLVEEVQIGFDNKMLKRHLVIVPKAGNRQKCWKVPYLC